MGWSESNEEMESPQLEFNKMKTHISRERERHWNMLIQKNTRNESNALFPSFGSSVNQIIIYGINSRRILVLTNILHLIPFTIEQY